MFVGIAARHAVERRLGQRGLDVQDGLRLLRRGVRRVAEQLEHLLHVRRRTACAVSRSAASSFR